MAAKAAPRPSTAASDARGSAEPPPSRSENQMPEPVRREKLKEFRRHLYEASLDHKGRCKPSEASDFPTKREQEVCKHTPSKGSHGEPMERPTGPVVGHVALRRSCTTT